MNAAMTGSAAEIAAVGLDGLGILKVSSP